MKKCLDSEVWPGGRADFLAGRPAGAAYVFFFRGGGWLGPCKYFSREVPEALVLLHFMKANHALESPCCKHFLFAGRLAWAGL